MISPAKEPKAGRFYLGIEGGSTKTVAVAMNRAGKIVERVRSTPCNLKLLEDREIVMLLEGIRERLSAQAKYIGAFVAGCVSPSDEARLTRLVQRVWPGSRVIAGTDADSGFAAALEDRPGVMVICGTGSNVLARNGPKTAKVGGWGHVVGDAGSSYDLSRQMLTKLFLEYDETHRINAFGRDVLRQVCLNTMDELVGWTLTAAKEDVAGLAPLVFKHRMLARDVISQATARLARQVVRASSIVGLRNPQVVLAGGLAAAQPFYVRKLREAILNELPKARVSLSQEEGAVGAARLCFAKFQYETGEHRLEPLHPPKDRGQLYRTSIQSRNLSSALTEQSNPRARHLETKAIPDLVELMISEEEASVPRIRQAREQIEQAAEWVATAFKQGGRLFYIGAGTSGRLGVLDASECPPTFSSPPEMVQGIIAGGFRALHQAIETAEDDTAYGAAAVRNRHVGKRDVVVGITASGSTPFVLSALGAAHEAGAKVVLLTCNPASKWSLPAKGFVKIAIPTGPEVVAGSTRLKAGTATKIVLNMLTTIGMIRLGKVKDNLMTDLQPSCEKLQDRMTRIFTELTGSSYEDAWSILKSHGWDLKTAWAKHQKRSDRQR